MPKSVTLTEGRVQFTGLTTSAAEQHRETIARLVERLAPEGVDVITAALRDTGPTITLQRIDQSFTARCWMSRGWSAWAVTAEGGGTDEAVLDVAPSTRTGTIIARIIGLAPGPDRSEDEEPIILGDQEFASWCSAEGVRSWRLGVLANHGTADRLTLEMIDHDAMGWFVAQRYESGGGAAMTLFPTSSRYLWRLLFSLIASALPITS